MFPLCSLSYSHNLPRVILSTASLCIYLWIHHCNRFYAAWCKSCQKMGLQFQRIANKLGDVVEEDGTVSRRGDLRFASVEYAANLDMCKSLGIKKLPTVFIYSRGQLVDNFPCGPKKMPLLLEKLEHYHGLSSEEIAFEASMKSGEQLGDAVLEQVIQTRQSQRPPSSQQNDGDKETKGNNSNLWPFSNAN